MHTAIQLILIIFGLTMGFTMPDDELRKIESQSNGHEVRQDDELFGYDCSKPGAKVKSISLLEVGACPTAPKEKNQESGYGQILQLSQVASVPVKVCRILRTTSIYRCGMHSHQMLVGGPFINEPVMLTRDDCERMINFKTWSVTQDFTITDLKMNRTKQIVITEFGSLAKDGSCEGSSFSYKDVTYHSSFMQVNYRITLKTFTAGIRTEDNIIHLENNLDCPHDEGHCYDDLNGISTWLPYKTSCNTQSPYLLYDGLLQLIPNATNPTVVAATHNKFFFVSRIKSRTHICGRVMLTTDYKDVVILIKTGFNPPLQVSAISSRAVDPVLYTNAKISYLHYQSVNDLRGVYNDIIFQLCKAEQKILENQINIIRLSQGHLNHILGLGTRGSVVHVQGEVAYITNCPLIKISLRATSDCYNGIPVVTEDDQIGFLMPVSRIFTHNVTRIPCSTITPPMFKMNNQWIAMYPNYVAIPGPAELSPKTDFTHNVTFINGFEEGGIYSTKDIQVFYENIAYSNRREVIINDMADGIIMGHPISHNIATLISEEGWRDIAKRQLTAMWGWFSNFGEIVSGLLGFYFIYMIIQKVISIIIRAATLHQLHGCSWRILASFWNATTVFFTGLVQREKNPDIVQETRTSNESPNDQLPAEIPKPLPIMFNGPSFEPYYKQPTPLSRSRSPIRFSPVSDKPDSQRKTPRHVSFRNHDGSSDEEELTRIKSPVQFI